MRSRSSSPIPGAMRVIKKLSTADLAEIIRTNPGCVLHVDNDSWKLTKVCAAENPYDIFDADEDEEFDEAAYDAWQAANELATYRDMIECNNVYAGDVLEALALLAKVTVEYA